MKRCPECRRDYYDDTLAFCLEDGTALVQGVVPSPDGPATAILTQPPEASSGQFGSESGTRAKISPTNATAVIPAKADDLSHKAGGFNKQLVLGLFALAVIVLAGFFGYRYFFQAKQIESIAVMPFVNESGNEDVEYLSDGMTETLINGLSQIPGLSVKARSSVFRYHGKDSAPKNIAADLGVQAILNGRLIQRGDQVILNVELIDGQTENTIWGNRYERKLSELVALQSDVAHDVSRRLKSRLSGADEAKVTKSYTTDPKALELYLKGRYFSRQFTLDGFNKGVDAFNQAIAIDPNYALAYAGLSDAYFYASTIHLPPAEALPKVGEYARKSLEVDDSLAAAHHSIANYKANYERDNAGAEREFERALELDPGDTSIYFDYSQLQSNVGDNEQGIALARRAKSIDPQDGGISYTLSQALVLSGRYDEGIEETRTTLTLDDKNWWGYYWRGLAFSEKGMHGEAIDALQTAASIDDSPLIRGVLAHSLARAGRRVEAQRVIDELVEASKTKFVSQSIIAMAYTGLGDLDKAFDWLDKSLASHDEAIVWVYRHPMFTQLRNERRYKELLKKLNLS
jgi:eukaryotic-like serine/threonine-protein kinase